MTKTKVIFENATVADSISKAAKVAPTRGEAFDKASGILIDLDAEEGTATLRTTDLQLFYLEVVDAVEVTQTATWRLNATILAEVVGKLPIGSGKTVSFEEVDGEIIMKSGRTTARFRKMDPTYYPTWDAYDPEKLEIVPDLGARIKQVSWAAMEDHETVFAGIHMDGQYVMATDRIRMAVAPCEAEPIYKPVTIPAGILKPVISNMRDVAVGIHDGLFLLMPDVSTQLSCRTYDREYPKITNAIFGREWPLKVSLRKTSLLEIIDRAVIFSRRDRSPRITFMIGKGEIAVMCSDADLGLLGDVIEVEGADHGRHKIDFTPKNLTEALNAAPSDQIELHYDNTKKEFPIKIDGGSGYIAVVMPRKAMEGGDEGSE